MPRFHARAEFRRRNRQAPWVLAGVILHGEFWPAVEGVERLRQRLPEAGLVGWADIDSPILAGDSPAAAEVAIRVARARWPDCARDAVPYAAGTRGTP